MPLPTPRPPESRSPSETIVIAPDPRPRPPTPRHTATADPSPGRDAPPLRRLIRAEQSAPFRGSRPLDPESTSDRRRNGSEPRPPAGVGRPPVSLSRGEARPFRPTDDPRRQLRWLAG